MADAESGEQMWRHREEDLSWREIDEEVILLDLKSAQYLRLNSTGALLWKRLTDGATASDLAECLQQTYALKASQATLDAAAFVASCVDNHLLLHCEKSE